MWTRVSLTEFASTTRRVRSGRPTDAAPLHTEACSEAGLVLVVVLTLATVAEYAARAMGWS